MTQELTALRAEGSNPALESRALGDWLLAAAGVEHPGGLVTVASTGQTSRVPWARRADWILFPEGDGLTLAPLSGARIAAGENLAGEERDDVSLDRSAAAIRVGAAPDVLLSRGALVRSVQMAGALERILELSLDHARQRRQFGRPIGTFQAVQAHLVTIAQQSALVSMAADGALVRERSFEVAVAKVLAGRAAVSAARAAHQVHGAVGVTRAHALGVETRRLWAWRCEFGDEREWAARLGDAVAHAGPDQLYPAITAGGRELEL